MRIITESGSVYEINDSRVCSKYDSDGKLIDAFKVFFIKAVPDTVRTMGELWDYPNTGKPEVGKLMYVGGKDGWWLSTKVVSVED